MVNFVVIDDYLLRGISVAEGLREFSAEHPEFGIGDIKILHYCNRREDCVGDFPAKFDIEDINILTFDEVVEKYFDTTNTIILSNLLLEDDEYGIGFIQRVNVRFILLHNRLNYGKFWFYDDLFDLPTSAIAAKYNVLPYFLGVKDTMVSNGKCRLDLDNEDFLSVLRGIHNE